MSNLNPATEDYDYLENLEHDFGFSTKEIAGIRKAIAQHDKQLRTKISVILRGIDQTEDESREGWWETSTGADFGKSKIEAIITLLGGKD